MIRKYAMAVVMQPRGHFVHVLSTLREEFVCAVTGRLINLNSRFLMGVQRAMAREDEVRRDAHVMDKSFGLHPLVPCSRPWY